MRKTIMTILVGSLVLGAFAAPMADAAKKKPKKYMRTAEVDYATPAIGTSVHAAGNYASGGACTGFPGDCISVPTTAKDKYLKVMVVDATGAKVSGAISQGDTDGDGLYNLVHPFCGGHATSVPITPGVPVGVDVYTGTCEDGSASTATTGTIKVTFSNKPF